jgi:hypothetical protein
MSLSARASERTSTGPSSSGNAVLRSSAPLTRAAPARRRASGRTASVVKPHAASAVSASAASPIMSTSRRRLSARACTGARLDASCSRGSVPFGPSDIVSERHSCPPISSVAKPSRAGIGGTSSGTSPPWSYKVPL